MALNRGYAYRSQVGPAAAGQRLIDWLGTSYRHSSPAQWAARLAGAELTLDDTPASGEERLRAGQVVIWQRPPWDEPDVPLTFEVVHEDEVVGYWSTTKFSGSIPADRKAALKTRVAKLRQAIKVAREDANTARVSERKMGDAILGYLFA